MADEPKTTNGGVPPKVDLKQTGAPATPKKQTTKIDFAAAAMVPDEKRKTSRVSMDEFLPPAGQAEEPATGTPGAIPKTIRLKKPGEQPASTIKVPKAPAPAEETTAPAPVPADDGKTKTSRISLEAALTPAEGRDTAGGPPTTTPKTIRIKRPGDAATSIPAEELSGKSKTARLDLTAEAAVAAGPATQRKTIRIKRPGEGAAPSVAGRTISITRPAEATAPEGVAAPEGDEPGVTFSILAIAAVLVVCVLIYVLAAQVFTGSNLPWPGKIVPM